MMAMISYDVWLKNWGELISPIFHELVFVGDISLMNLEPIYNYGL